MTATEVNGVAVIADQSTPSPIKDRGGNVIMWTQTRMLLLADGRVTYGCVHCDYTHDSPHAVRPHLNVHKDARPPKPATGAKSMTLDQLIARVADLRKIEADRDQWKARAIKAEKSLATLRQALLGSGGN